MVYINFPLSFQRHRRWMLKSNHSPRLILTATSGFHVSSEYSQLKKILKTCQPQKKPAIPFGYLYTS